MLSIYVFLHIHVIYVTRDYKKIFQYITTMFIVTSFNAFLLFWSKTLGSFFHTSLLFFSPVVLWSYPILAWITMSPFQFWHIFLHVHIAYIHPGVSILNKRILKTEIQIPIPLSEFKNIFSKGFQNPAAMCVSCPTWKFSVCLENV